LEDGRIFYGGTRRSSFDEEAFIAEPTLESVREFNLDFDTFYFPPIIGTRNHLEDLDADQLPDYWEAYWLLTHPAHTGATDFDNDGLTNLEEYQLRTNPRSADSDGDGLGDNGEVNSRNTDPALVDSDGDRLPDGQEVFVHSTDPLDQDTDDDGLSDFDEAIIHGTDPLLVDTDADGMDDKYEVDNNLPATVFSRFNDADRDGLGDFGEFTRGTDPNNSDSDGDGLTDGQEHHLYKTDPLTSDTDGDGLGDKWEVDNQLDPLDSLDGNSDNDQDGYSNLDEFNLGTDPNDATSFENFPEWNQFLGNAQNTSSLPFNIEPQIVSEKWRYTLPDDGGRLSSLYLYSTQPIVANGIVYLLSDSEVTGSRRIIALDAITGDELWFVPYSSTSHAVDLVVSGLVLFSLERDESGVVGNVRRRNALTGALLSASSTFLAPEDGFIDKMTLTDDGVLVYSGVNAFLYELDGTQRWGRSLRFASRRSEIVKLAYQNGEFAIKGPDFFRFLREASGVESPAAELEISPPLSNCFISVYPAISSLTLVEDAFAINTDECTAVVSSTPTAANAVPLLAETEGDVYENINPVSIGNSLIAATEDGLTVSDRRSGELLWTYENDFAIRSIVASRNLVAFADSYKTIIVDMSTQEQVARFEIGGFLALSTEGILVIAGENRKVLGIQIENLDSDNDGIPNWWERKFGLNAASASDRFGDIDADGLSNLAEYRSRANSHVSDTDGDGIADNVEFFTYGTSPRKLDTDDDGISDVDEIVGGTTDPANGDSDGDGVLDGFDSAPTNSTIGAPTNLDTDKNSFAEIITHGTSDATIVLSDTFSGQTLSFWTYAGFRRDVDDNASYGINFYDLAVIDDFNGNGVFDILIYGKTAYGNLYQVFDGSTQQLIHSNVFDFDDAFGLTSGSEMAKLNDINTDGFDEVALLMSFSRRQSALVTMDIANTQELHRTDLPAWFDAESVIAVPDLNGNGANDLVVYGKVAANNNPLWIKFDGSTGQNLGQVSYPGWFTPSQVYLGPDFNNNGAASIITLGRTSGGSYLWIAQDSLLGTNVKQYGYPGWISPREIAVVDDANGDGLSDIVTYASTPRNTFFWQRNDANTGALQRRQGFPGWLVSHETIDIIEDVNSNGNPEVIIFGRSSSGRDMWLKNDSMTGANLGSLVLPTGRTYSAN
jgi:hypothetical protein